MLELKFKVHIKIQKPIHEVFDAVANPKKLSEYFTTGGASGPLEAGKTVIWRFADFPGDAPVRVKEVVPDRRIVFEWGEGDGSDMLQAEIAFEPLDDGSTLVNISEGQWRPDQQGLDRSYGNCMGWSQMLCALKAFVEYGINLRKGAY
jgi:uncharacterized protein YndB with AHSA1/START domain